MGTIETPIGRLPQYKDLKTLFSKIIDKQYPASLYEKQFSLYTDNILDRINMQMDAYSKETNIPARLFEILEEQRDGLMELQRKHGAVVSPENLLASG